MTNGMTYAVDDTHGNLLTTGLQEHEAHRVAQRIADDRQESVYLYDADDPDRESETIEPTDDEPDEDIEPDDWYEQTAHLR